MKNKVLIVGFGSIGQRHYSKFLELKSEVAIVSKHFKNDREIICFNDLDTGIKEFGPDIIIIANKTFEHVNTLITLQKTKYDGFILCEKPLFEKNYSSDLIKGLTGAIGYNLRFHPGIQKLKEFISDQNPKVLAIDIYCGQYLPEWRPQSDYSKGYSASKEQGGGVLRDLSHELDYIYYLFGKMKVRSSVVKKISELKINSEDYVSIIGTTDSGAEVSLRLNYLDKKASRSIKIITSDDTYSVDLINNTFFVNNDQINMDGCDTYRAQAEEVLNQNESKQMSTFNDGMYIMELIETIEQKSVKE